MKVKELVEWLKECNQDAEIEISVDVSKDDSDFGNRVYADISEVLVTFMDGLTTVYMVNDHQFGLPDGHGGIACASTQDVMNAYLGMDMEKEMTKDDSLRQVSETKSS